MNLFKPPGCSSHDLVGHVRRSLQVRKVGHCGTLDPGAGGVMVILVGKATRIQQYMVKLGKSYVAELTFGVTTDSGDGFGKVITTGPTPSGPKAVNGVIGDFIGTIDQVPPMTSAIKRNGVPLYQLARRGMSVKRDSRKVRIERLQMLDWRGGPPARVLLRVDCSAGTYVRVLLQDIARAAGSCGYMSFLVRQRVGHFVADDSILPDDVHKDNLVPMSSALKFMKQVRLKEDDVRLVANGARPRQIEPAVLSADEPLCLLAPSGELAAVARVVQQRDGARKVDLMKVFAQTDG